ncbi:glycosyltransferase [Mastigocoleus sp. MO_188.B34]|uniref:glycosyltransferase n=1 Tax=Mastigocoleus sp. MO_188.B34 TaxID=3036635 RepID=UPI002629B341|nr:glycosyltransferase [Mastigocoleus sp. MO_188.B34]MDJ0694378.1 glycosyltransferase [Mastigocoleus sp. MO_188.B34]
MKYHIALSRQFDLEGIHQDAQAGKRPCHVMWDISQTLKATIYQPVTEEVLPLDTVRAKVISSPQHWALARRLALNLGSEDVIFCAGEDVGFPIATLCSSKQEKPKIIVFTHNVNRPRSRFALKMLEMSKRVDLFMTYTPSQADFLSEYLNLPQNRICLFLEQPTDISFFKPGSISQNKRRPLIASGGLEKRDYCTLAKATHDLDIDVKICAVSPNAAACKRAFPEILPDNMSCHAYDWGDLLQLYRDCDLAVISLFKNNYQAGLTTMFEALACRRPVVITRCPGIIQDLIDSGIVLGVDPENDEQLREVILKLLNNPKQARVQAEKGYQLMIEKYNHRQYIQAFVKEITAFEK